MRTFEEIRIKLNLINTNQFTILMLIPSVDFNRKLRKNCGVPNNASKNTARNPIVSI